MTDGKLTIISYCYAKYDPRFRLLIIRHGESEGNISHEAYKKWPDNALPLTERGREQAHEAGKFVNAFFRQRKFLQEHTDLAKARLATIDARNKLFQDIPLFEEAFPDLAVIPSELPDKPHVRLWYSPFRRTQETKDGIIAEAGDVIADTRENPFIYEILFGLNDGLADSAVLEALPAATQHYEHYKSGGGRYFAQMLLGESRAEVEQRCIHMFDTIHRDAQNSDIWNHIIVSHGLTARILAKAWMKYTIEQFEQERNPGNCWVRYLEDHRKDKRKDHGWVYSGEARQISDMEQGAIIR